MQTHPYAFYYMLRIVKQCFINLLIELSSFISKHADGATAIPQRATPFQGLSAPTPALALWQDCAETGKLYARDLKGRLVRGADSPSGFTPATLTEKTLS